MPCFDTIPADQTRTEDTRYLSLGSTRPRCHQEEHCWRFNPRVCYARRAEMPVDGSMVYNDSRFRDCPCFPTGLTSTPIVVEAGTRKVMLDEYQARE